MRNLMVWALWLGIGFGLTELVSLALERSQVEKHEATHQSNEATRDIRDARAPEATAP